MIAGLAPSCAPYRQHNFEHTFVPPQVSNTPPGFDWMPKFSSTQPACINLNLSPRPAISADTTLTRTGQSFDYPIANPPHGSLTVTSQAVHLNSQHEGVMEKTNDLMNRAVNRRSLLKTGAFAGGAIAIGAGLMSSDARAFDRDGDSDRLTPGDAAILRFALVAELIEADLWTQYAELVGFTPGDLPLETLQTNPSNSYQNAFLQLDGDGPQYISSNTLDEVSHAAFLNAYLISKGAETVDLDAFRTLPGSQATGSARIGRLTNLTKLTVDTSWFTRYRSAKNPDFGATFPQALDIQNRTAIPITDNDFSNTNHIQVIANIAAFHFGYIEQGGSSLYPALGRKASSLEVLKITQGIGGDEIAHFLEWVDFAGNAVQQPVAPVSDAGLTFPDFFAPINPNEPPSASNSNNVAIQPSLIFPVPCEFISANLPHCAVIRPLDDRFAGAVATIASFTADGLFIGQSKEFFKVVNQFAEEADAARRES